MTPCSGNPALSQERVKELLKQKKWPIIPHPGTTNFNQTINGFTLSSARHHSVNLLKLQLQANRRRDIQLLRSRGLQGENGKTADESGDEKSGQDASQSEDEQYQRTFKCAVQTEVNKEVESLSSKFK
ncbi:hypothetical protein CAPTEDRAFT_203121 [Capitella teleta]|uniref:Uncharacterized protein n=1 Tax=Capitella teleta TaxID=283909 RepID=R7V910_CAPTE|nr:hypothetical protein CAPTEDRAFT_203121 [Capitella teleta]|eukprot:ELU15333.1 hypothetical protein CAPTEDRAFT_203121 [Capitella teleta]